MFSKGRVRMEIRSEEDILSIIREDRWMMDILVTVQGLGLPDWWVCAGFVTGKFGMCFMDLIVERQLQDVDVVNYDAHNLLESEAKRLEAKLHSLRPGIPWSVKNEARIHEMNDLPPYTSAEDAISKFPETATSLGIPTNQDNELVLPALHGIHDQVNVSVRPRP